MNKENYLKKTAIKGYLAEISKISNHLKYGIGDEDFDISTIDLTDIKTLVSAIEEIAETNHVKSLFEEDNDEKIVKKPSNFFDEDDDIEKDWEGEEI